MSDSTGLGYIQRNMLVWFHDNRETKVSVADFCDHVGCRATRSSMGSVAEAQKYYKAARQLKKRSLIMTRREGKTNWVELTPEGHRLAYQIREDAGQNRLPL